MFTLNIWIKTAGNISLAFESEEKAEKAVALITSCSELGLSDLISVVDDYGHRLDFNKTDALFCLITSVDRELDSQIQIKIKQAKAQMRMQNDPAMRLVGASPLAINQ